MLIIKIVNCKDVARRVPTANGRILCVPTAGLVTDTKIIIFTKNFNKKKRATHLEYPS